VSSTASFDTGACAAGSGRGGADTYIKYFLQVWLEGLRLHGDILIYVGFDGKPRPGLSGQAMENA